MRIGLLGGSFDPFHEAHLQMALQAIKNLQLDAVWLVLSANTPLKNRELMDYTKRYNLIKHVIKPYRKIKICTIEQFVSGPNYTIDTVKKLQSQYPNYEFIWILGADQASNLHNWHAIDELKTCIKFAYFQRDDLKVDDDGLIAMNNFDYPHSSTAVRLGNLTYLNKGIRSLYVINNPVILSNYMSEYRYKHSVSCADFAVKLAQIHHLDTKKAYLMGLLHDVNKEFKLLDQEASKQILQAYQQDGLLAMNIGCWHGFIGAYLANHYFGVYDQDVLKAISHHVLGDSENIYAKLLYLADKLELSRDYPMVDTYRQLAYQDLHAAHRLVVKVQSARHQEG